MNLQNQQRKFDQLQTKYLGVYVYALRDPRDRKVFYVGQGAGNRVFSHFNAADKVKKKPINLKTVNSKILRILDIWKNGEDVEWFIVARDLDKTKVAKADLVESAAFDILLESQNGETLNEISPPNSTMSLSDDLIKEAAPFVGSPVPLTVFIFPIHNTLTNGASIYNYYNATRSAWTVTQKYRTLKSAFAVGLKNSVSVGSFEIASWSSISAISKHEFTSPGHPNPTDYQPLLNKNWSKVIAAARGFWQRGNYLIAEFDGKGKFRIVRGSQDKEWHKC